MRTAAARIERCRRGWEPRVAGGRGGPGRPRTRPGTAAATESRTGRGTRRGTVSRASDIAEGIVACHSRRLRYELGRGQLHELAHPCGLRLHDPPPQCCNPVISPPLIIEMRIGAVVRLFDKALREHLADGAVEDARAKRELPVGPSRDLALQGVAVPLAIQQRQ